MIDNNIIFENKKVKDDIKAFLGISGENEQERLVFSFADGFVDGICNLEVEFQDGYKFVIEELEKDVENQCYKLIVQSGLLTQEGWLKMQLKIIKETEVWKSITFKMFVEHAIKASEAIEKQYPNFVEITKIKTRELEQGFKQVVEKANKTVEDLNQSKENIKTNTEDIEKLKADVKTNTTNITKANEDISSLQEKLDKLKNYDDTEVRKLVADLEKDLLNYYLKSETFSKDEIRNLINGISRMHMETVNVLPTENISTTTIYLVSSAKAEENNVYDEYIYIEGNWEIFGSTKLDLTGYAKEDWVLLQIADFLTETEVNNLINTALENYYTKTEINNLLKDEVVIGTETPTSTDWKIFIDESEENVNLDSRMLVKEMTELNVAIKPNIYYKWGEVSDLSITLVNAQDNEYTNEYCFEFSSGETATTLTLDDTIKWVSEPNIEANKIYQVSILNGIGVIAGA